ncbi:MAG TPA: dTDP-4-dehydrorhamnose 3,5-epimerase, partial [Polyangiaceae bacterium]|nr:dTDP-4-dehydrorhamnose 3,5-epimerase [Polyangiaceae bacterium]
IPPRAQGKLVRVVRGSVLDVAVDLRRHSASYGRHVAVELSAENARQLWVPAGFAHGVCTLEPDTILAYKVTDYWSPDHERTLRFNDPELKIPCPVSENEMTVNARDREAPLLQELEGWF